jgi:hypothetical protein
LRPLGNGLIRVQSRAGGVALYRMPPMALTRSITPQTLRHKRPHRVGVRSGGPCRWARPAGGAGTRSKAGTRSCVAATMRPSPTRPTAATSPQTSTCAATRPRRPCFTQGLAIQGLAAQGRATLGLANWVLATCSRPSAHGTCVALVVAAQPLHRPHRL